MKGTGVPIKLVLALLLPLLCLAIAACGGGSTKSTISEGVVGEFGHPAGVVQTRAVTALVQRYYVSAAAEQSATACGMLFFALAETLPEMYGGAPGPRYLEGAKTCQAVLARVFKRFHAQLELRPTVTLVRVKGNLADAVLTWKELPSGYIQARREGDVWKLNGVLATALN